MFAGNVNFLFFFFFAWFVKLTYKNMLLYLRHPSALLPGHLDLFHVTILMNSVRSIMLSMHCSFHHRQLCSAHSKSTSLLNIYFCSVLFFLKSLLLIRSFLLLIIFFTKVQLNQMVNHQRRRQFSILEKALTTITSN